VISRQTCMRLAKKIGVILKKDREEQDGTIFRWKIEDGKTVYLKESLDDVLPELHSLSKRKK